MKSFWKWNALFSFAALVCASQAAQSQIYPASPVKIISDSSPGSAPDVISRIVGELLGLSWGQQVIVINQPGASGSRAARVAASADPDGYTLLMAVSSAFVTVKGSAPGIPIEVPRDFAPISVIGEQPMFMAVAPQLGVKMLSDFLALAKQKPGEISYAVSGRGRQSHLTGEMLQRQTGVKLLMVPYSSGGPAQAIGDLASGRIHMIIEGGTALLGSMQPGFLHVMAVASEKRLVEFPDLPTAAESVPGFRAAGWLALVAPTGTPTSIVEKVSGDLTTILNQTEVRKRLASLGSYARPMSPRDTLSYIQGEQSTWGPILDGLSTPPQ